MLSLRVLWGALLALAGNAFIASSYTLQKAAHNAGGGAKTYMRWQFLVGFALMGPGELGNVAALAFAPTRLVTGLGCATIVFTSLLAHRFLSERVGRGGWWGAAACAVAGVLFVIGAGDRPPFDSMDGLVVQLQRPAFLTFIFISMAITLFASLSSSLFACVFCMGVYGCITVISTKAAVRLYDLIGFGDIAVYGSVQWIVGCVSVLFIVLQCVWFQRALANHAASKFVPLHYLSFNAFSATAAGLLYGEFVVTPGQMAAYGFALVVAVAGTALVTRASPGRAYAAVEEEREMAAPVGKAEV